LLTQQVEAPPDAVNALVASRERSTSLMQRRKCLPVPRQSYFAEACLSIWINFLLSLS
jgi:hypothetical protein